MSQVTISTIRVWDGSVEDFKPSTTPACHGESSPTVEGYQPEGALDVQRAVCVGCPVFTQCASHSLNHEPYGVWALTEDQRWHLGGVVPEEWSELVPNPQAAIDELIGGGLSPDEIMEVLDRAGLLTDEIFNILDVTDSAARELASTPLAATAEAKPTAETPHEHQDASASITPLRHPSADASMDADTLEAA